jgi:hypothetical protein
MPKGVSATGRISANRKTTGRKTTGRKTTGRKTTGFKTGRKTTGRKTTGLKTTGLKNTGLKATERDATSLKSKTWAQAASSAMHSPMVPGRKTTGCKPPGRMTYSEAIAPKVDTGQPGGTSTGTLKEREHAMEVQKEKKAKVLAQKQRSAERLQRQLDRQRKKDTQASAHTAQPKADSSAGRKAIAPLASSAKTGKKKDTDAAASNSAGAIAALRWGDTGAKTHVLHCGRCCTTAACATLRPELHCGGRYTAVADDRSSGGGGKRCLKPFRDLVDHGFVYA